MSIERLEIKFKGLNMRPELLSIDELTELLKSFEKALKSIIRSNDQDIEIPNNFISLVGISNRSVGLQTVPNHIESQVKLAFKNFSKAAEEPNPDLLSRETAAALMSFSSFNKKHNSVMKIGFTKGNKFEQIGEFKGYKATRMHTFHDKRTFYGELLEIGGDKENPKATILQYNGKTIQGHVTEDMVKLYRNLTYEEVRAIGLATINGQTLTPQYFKVEKIEAYKTLSPTESIESIRDALRQKHE